MAIAGATDASQKTPTSGIDAEPLESIITLTVLSIISTLARPRNTLNVRVQALHSLRQYLVLFFAALGRCRLREVLLLELLVPAQGEYRAGGLKLTTRHELQLDAEAFANGGEVVQAKVFIKESGDRNVEDELTVVISAFESGREHAEDEEFRFQATHEMEGVGPEDRNVVGEELRAIRIAQERKRQVLGIVNG